MVVLLLVEGRYLTEVMANWRNMVCNYINHNPDVHGMSGGNKTLERGIVTKVAVNLFPVSGPIAVVASIQVIHDR